MNKDNIGFKGEEYACNYLENKEYQIIARNFMCNQGEIDIVAKDKNELVFIEVKTRTNLKYGNPVDAVDKNKTKHIWNATKFYLYKNNLEKEYVRFDVIEVYIIAKGYRINHIKNVMM